MTKNILALQEINKNVRRSNKIKMNTKILSVFLMSVLMLSVMGTFVLADEKEVSADAGLSQAEIASATADDNVEGSSGIFSDRVRLVFAANIAKKSKIRTKIAAKKMNQLKAEKDPEKAKKIAKEYKEELENAFEDFNEIAVDGDKEEVMHALKQTVIMKYRLESHQIKVEELQENLIARLLVVAPELSEDEIRTKLEAFENSLDKKRQLREEQFKSKIEAELKAANGDIKQKFELKADDQRIKIETEDDSDDEVIALN